MPLDPNLPERRRMVDEQIRRRGITDERVLAAMTEVPRELFIPGADIQTATSDRALPLAHGQTISQPFVVAAMTALLDLAPHHRVLEVGTGSGYQTAILARLACRVFTVERLAPLQTAAREMLLALGFDNISFRIGDGSEGWPEEAPFDRIIVTAGAPEAPPPLLAQLTADGRLVIPLGNESEQTLTVIDRHHGQLLEHPQFPCRFVKLIGHAAWPPPPAPPLSNSGERPMN